MGLWIGQKPRFECSVTNYRPRGNLSLIINQLPTEMFENQTHVLDNQSQTYTSYGAVQLKIEDVWNGQEALCCITLETQLRQCSSAKNLSEEGK